MERALYDPERGFYARRQPRADFYTAPELHPAFAAVLAKDVAKRLDALRAAGVPGPLTVVEMGSGEGALAEQMLSRLPRGVRYVLVERCEEMLERAHERLARRFENVEACVSLAELEPCAGVFLSNELVDAFPVHVLEKSGGAVRELYVARDGGTTLAELSTPELQPHASSVSAQLEEGGLHAVNLEAAPWMADVAERLLAGWVLTIDYGKRFGGAPNPPRGFYRHTHAQRLTDRQGEQDLTASVDFDVLIGAGEQQGLRAETYCTLGRYLLDGGIADFMPMGDSAFDFKSRAQIKTLLHPEGMGEAFKVLIQTRGLLS